MDPNYKDKNYAKKFEGNSFKMLESILGKEAAKFMKDTLPKAVKKHLKKHPVHLSFPRILKDEEHTKCGLVFKQGMKASDESDLVTCPKCLELIKNKNES
jgi:hypothetical protein